MSAPLNKLCELIVDCPHSTVPDEGEGYPLIRTPNIGSGYLDLTDVHRVSKETYDIRNARAVPQPMDLILAREAPAGNVGIIREGQWVCLGQRTVLIRPDQNKVDPWFLNYYLNAPRQRHRLLSNANGATVSHVNMPIIRNLPIDLPCMKVQRRIASILMAYDNLIENNRRQIALLEEAAQRLYKEWFVDLRFPGHQSIKVVNGLPIGWTKCELGAVVCQSGKAEKKSNRENYSHYLPIDSIPSKSITCWDSDTIENASSSLVSFKRDDYVFGAMRPYFHKVIIAPYAGLTRTTCFVLNVADSDYWAYAFALLTFGDCVRYATSISVGTTMPYVRWEDLRHMPIVVPNKELAVAFKSHLTSIRMRVEALYMQIADAREARDRLLPKLMSGEIEVVE